MVSYADPASLPCRGCGKGFRDTDPVRLFEQRRWHVRCFKCQSCFVAIANDTEPYASKGLPYCATCYEDVQYEVCDGCQGKLIPPVTVVKPNGLHKQFHKECFRCTKCDFPITEGFKKRGKNILCHYCARGQKRPEAEQPAAAPPAAADPEPAAPAAAASAAPASAPRFCTECGAKRVSGAKFCGECGNKL